MRRDDLMRPDLLSEIVLVGSGIAIVLGMVMIALSAFTPVIANR